MVCDDCPELMTCYEGVCDCDRDSTLKIWERCFAKYPSRYFCFEPDTNFGMTTMILDSVYFDPNSNKYRFESYSDEYERIAGIFLSNGKKDPFRYSAQFKPQNGYDSIFFEDNWITLYTVGNEQFFRSMLGKYFSRDSMELRIIHQNIQTYERDTSRPMTFYSYDYN